MKMFNPDGWPVNFTADFIKQKPPPKTEGVMLVSQPDSMSAS
jgi:hypothetical protein